MKNVFFCFRVKAIIFRRKLRNISHDDFEQLLSRIAAYTSPELQQFMLVSFCCLFVSYFQQFMVICFCCMPPQVLKFKSSET